MQAHFGPFSFFILSFAAGFRHLLLYSLSLLPHLRLMLCNIAASNIPMHVIMDTYILTFMQYIMSWNINTPTQTVFEHEEYKILLKACASVWRVFGPSELLTIRMPFCIHMHTTAVMLTRPRGYSIL